MNDDDADDPDLRLPPYDETEGETDVLRVLRERREEVRRHIDGIETEATRQIDAWKQILDRLEATRRKWGLTKKPKA